MNEIPMTGDEKQKVQMLREMVEYKVGIPEILKILRDANGNENAALDEILSIVSGELNQSRQISAPPPVNVSPVVNPPPVNVDPMKDAELELIRLKLEEQKNEERRRDEEFRRKLEREEEERKEREQLEAIKQRIEEEQKRKEELELQRQLLENERRRVEREKMELELIRRDELFKREEEKRKQEELLKKQEEERIALLRIKEEEEAAEFIRQAALKKKQEEEERIALLRMKEEEERAAAEEKEKQMKLAELEKIQNPTPVEEIIIPDVNNNNSNDNKGKDESLAFIREEELTRSRMGMFNLEPIVLIYFRPAQDNYLVNPRAQAKNLTDIFTNLGVQPFGIQVADISTDFELGSYLKSCFPEEPNLFPFICIHRKPVGNYLKIKQLQNDGTLMTYVNSPELIPELHRETFSYRQDVLDKALDAAEFLLTNTLYLPYSILTWPFGKAKENNSANARNTDIPVVHHNWYSRGTKRLLRFSSESISRIHPSYLDQIRAEHKYSDVENVSFPSEKYDFVIKYLDGVADYYTCTKADLDIVKEIVRTKCKDNSNFTNF